MKKWFTQSIVKLGQINPGEPMARPPLHRSSPLGPIHRSVVCLRSSVFVKCCRKVRKLRNCDTVIARSSTSDPEVDLLLRPAVVARGAEVGDSSEATVEMYSVTTPNPLDCRGWENKRCCHSLCHGAFCRLFFQALASPSQPLRLHKPVH